MLRLVKASRCRPSSRAPRCARRGRSGRRRRGGRARAAWRVDRGRWRSAAGRRACPAARQGSVEMWCCSLRSRAGVGPGCIGSSGLTDRTGLQRRVDGAVGRECGVEWLLLPVARPALCSARAPATAAIEWLISALRAMWKACHARRCSAGSCRWPTCSASGQLAIWRLRSASQRGVTSKPLQCVVLMARAARLRATAAIEASISALRAAANWRSRSALTRCDRRGGKGVLALGELLRALGLAARGARARRLAVRQAHRQLPLAQRRRRARPRQWPAAFW